MQMSPPTRHSPDTRRAAPEARVPFLYRALGRLIAPWLAIRREPAPSSDVALVRPGVAVCYVIERYGLSNALILEQACREAGLPSPLMAMPDDLVGSGRAVVALSRRQRAWFGRPKTRTHSEGLARLIAAIEADPALDVQLVPVSIFVGRAPDRQSKAGSACCSRKTGRWSGASAASSRCCSTAATPSCSSRRPCPARGAGRRAAARTQRAQALARAARALPPHPRGGHRA
jgi:glycerol-3-phosphate O-acyltransferase